MPNINIGKNYEEVFKSICQLSNITLQENNQAHGLLSDYVKSASWDDGIIVVNNGDSEFIYKYNPQILDVEIDGVEDDVNLKITKKGASWFNDLRGLEVNDKGSWQTLIDYAANEYHKRYAYIEYDQSVNPLDVTQLKLDGYKEKVDKLLKFFGNNTFYDVSFSPVQESVDIYGVNLRLQIEEEKPILCKVFFREYRGKRIPLFVNDAKNLDEALSLVPESQSNEKKKSNTKKNSENVNKVLRSFEELISPTTPIELKDCLLYSSSEDENIIDNLLGKNSMIGIKLICKEVRVFSVMHIKWQLPTLDLKYNGKSYYKCTLNFGNELSLKCEGCGELLVENNSCTILKDDAETSIVLDFNEPNFGVSDADRDEIVKQIFLKHNSQIECNNELHCRNIRCRKTRCASQCSEANGKYFCKNCPYPEVVSYTFNFDGDFSLGKLPTAMLNYSADEQGLIQEETTKCACCGREVLFVKKISGKKLCSVCSNLYSEKKPSTDSVKLYKQYRGMIPVISRGLHLFSTKACYEDCEILTFKLGKKYYIYNKLFSSKNELRDYSKLQRVKKIK